MANYVYQVFTSQKKCGIILVENYTLYGKGGEKIDPRRVPQAHKETSRYLS
jgi:hypothetical protein